jgi:hypothetical protein
MSFFLKVFMVRRPTIGLRAVNVSLYLKFGEVRELTKKHNLCCVTGRPWSLA